jgi:hypothetical protein
MCKNLKKSSGAKGLRTCEKKGDPFENQENDGWTMLKMI